MSDHPVLPQFGNVPGSQPEPAAIHLVVVLADDGLAMVATLSAPCSRSGVVGSTISPSSGWVNRSSMPRACM